MRPDDTEKAPHSSMRGLFAGGGEEREEREANGCHLATCPHSDRETGRRQWRGWGNGEQTNIDHKTKLDETIIVLFVNFRPLSSLREWQHKSCYVAHDCRKCYT